MTSADALSPHLETTFLRGDDTAVTVFLHGLMGRGKNFMSEAKALLPVSSALLIDAPNHGASAWSDDFYYTKIAAQTAAYIRSRSEFVPDAGVHLVGHSMGGKTAMVLALQNPELVRSLTVVDISPVQRRGGDSFRHLITSLLSLDVTHLTSRSEVDNLLREAIPDSTVRAFLLQNLHRTETGFVWQANLRLLLREIGTIMGFPAAVEGLQYSGPTLWLRGENSDYTADSDLQVMHSMFPDAVPVTVPHAGHWVHADQPELFVRLLREFILENSPVREK